MWNISQNQKLLLDLQTILKIFVKILIITIQKGLKMLILFDDATRVLISNKTFEAIVIKLSIRGRTFEKKY